LKNKYTTNLSGYKTKTNILHFVKNRFKNIVLILISSLLFVFGNSVNIWHFCCDVCRDHANEVIINGDCSLYHEHDNNNYCETAQSRNHSGFCNGNCFADIAIHEGCGHESCYEECFSITLDDYTSIPNIKSFCKIFSSLALPTILKPAEPKYFLTYKNLYAEAVPSSGRQILQNNCTLRR